MRAVHRGPRTLACLLTLLCSAGAASAQAPEAEASQERLCYEWSGEVGAGAFAPPAKLLVPRSAASAPSLDIAPSPSWAELLGRILFSRVPEDGASHLLAVELPFAGCKARIEGERRLDRTLTEAKLSGAIELTIFKGERTLLEGQLTWSALRLESLVPEVHGRFVGRERAGDEMAPLSWSGAWKIIETPRLVPTVRIAPRPDPALDGDVSDAARAREAAIAKGREALLKSEELATSHADGEIALRLLALLRSGIPPDSEVVVNGFKQLATMPMNQTYSVSLRIMAREARSIRRVPPRGLASVPRYQRGEVGGDDLDQIRKLAGWLISARLPGEGVWTYGSFADRFEAMRGSGFYDHSNTQFAVLALHAAQRAGVELPKPLWKEVLDHFLAYQADGLRPGTRTIEVVAAADEPEATTRERSAMGSADKPLVRGWGYRQKRTDRPAMCAAGLGCLAIAAEGYGLPPSGPLRDKVEAALRDGMQSVAEVLSADLTRVGEPGANPPGWGQYYLLYSIEKAFELCGVLSIDGEDWFEGLARKLLALQDKDGQWGENPIDTSLALLTLNRATLGKTNVVSGSGTVAEAIAPDEVYIESLDATISLNDLLLQLPFLDTGERARRKRAYSEGIARLPELERPIVARSLLDLTEDRKTRSWAFTQLRKVTACSRLRDREDGEAWVQTWEILRQAPAAHDLRALETIREVLQDDRAGLLRRVALDAAAKLRAFEHLDLILSLRSEAELSADINAALMQLLGQVDVSEEAVARWQAESCEAALAHNARRRAVIATFLKGQLPEGWRSAAPEALALWVELCADPTVGDAAATLLCLATCELKDKGEWGRWWQTWEAVFRGA